MHPKKEKIRTRDTFRELGKEAWEALSDIKNSFAQDIREIKEDLKSYSSNHRGSMSRGLDAQAGK